MTDDNMAVLALIQKTDDGDFLKSVAEAALQRIMDYDVENLIGAAPLERSAERLNDINSTSSAKKKKKKRRKKKKKATTITTSPAPFRWRSTFDHLPEGFAVVRYDGEDVLKVGYVCRRSLRRDGAIHQRRRRRCKGQSHPRHRGKPGQACGARAAAACPGRAWNARPSLGAIARGGGE